MRANKNGVNKDQKDKVMNAPTRGRFVREWGLKGAYAP